MWGGGGGTKCVKFQAPSCTGLKVSIFRIRPICLIMNVFAWWSYFVPESFKLWNVNAWHWLVKSPTHMKKKKKKKNCLLSLIFLALCLFLNLLSTLFIYLIFSKRKVFPCLCLLLSVCLHFSLPLPVSLCVPSFLPSFPLSICLHLSYPSIIPKSS